MRFITWNINGLRSTEDEFLKLVNKFLPDVIALQEVRSHPDKIGFMLKTIPDYNVIWNWAEKTGYSGTAVYYKQYLNIKNVIKNFDNQKFESEGRVIEITFDKFSFINVYTPLGNKIKEGERMSYRQAFMLKLEDVVQKFLKTCKNLIIVGDFNIVASALDVYDGNVNRDWVVFSEWNRNWYYSFIRNFNLIDVYRVKNSKKTAETWWANWDKSRKNGLRLDYIFTSKTLYNSIKDVQILKDWHGSDHCPVLCDINF